MEEKNDGGAFSWLPEKTPNQRFVLVVVVVAILTSPFWGYWLYSSYEERQKCEGEVVFHPATQSVSGSSVWTDQQGKAEYYTWGASSFGRREFKTKAEAVEYCLR